MTTFTNRHHWIAPLVALGLSTIACGPAPGDGLVEPPFSPPRDPRSSTTGSRPTR